MAYSILDRVYSIFIDIMTGISAGSGSATFSNSNIKWQNSVPNIEADKWYEFIFTRTHSGIWLAGVAIYG